MLTHVPAASTIQLERMRELEAALQLRRSEIEALRRRRAQLVAAQKEKEAQKGPSKSPRARGGDDDPLSNPVVQMCVQNTLDPRTVPVHMVGSTVAQMEAAAAMLQKNIGILDKSILEGELQVKSAEKRIRSADQQFELVRDLVGLPPVEPCVKSASHQSRRERHLKESNAPAATAVGADVSTINLENKKTNNLINQIGKELHAAKLLITKKERCLRDLDKEIETKKDRESATLALHNKIRVADRDIRERKLFLWGLIREHESLDGGIASVQAVQQRSPVPIMTRDVATIRQKIADIQEDEKRIQERVSKAQDYRLNILRRRLAMIESAVKTHSLAGDVEGSLSKALDLARRLEAAPTGHDVSACSAKSAAEDIATQSVEDLYDIDAIIPPIEKIHPAIYSLFLSEKERLEKRANVLRILAAEKTAAAAEFSEQVQKLKDQKDDAQTTLLSTRRAAARVEVENKEEMLAELTADRARLQSLMSEETELKKQARVLRLKIAEIASSPAPLGVSASTHFSRTNSPQGGSL